MCVNLVTQKSQKSRKKRYMMSVLLTYLRLLDKRLGILVNFNTDNILNSITRVVN